MSTLAVNTITAETGTTVTIASGKKLVSTSAIEAPGTVIQTVQVANSASHNNNSTSTWANTNYTISITPQYSNSVLEYYYVVPFRLNSNGSPMRGGFRVYRDISGGSSNLIINTTSNFEQHQVRNATNEYDDVWSGIMQDTPGTTSQVTYRIQSYIHGDSGAQYITTYDANIGGNLLVKEIKQ